MNDSPAVKETDDSQELHIAKKTKALFKRLATAVVCLPLLVVFIIHGGTIAFTVLVTIAIMLGIRELYNMAAPDAGNWSILRISGFLAAALLPLAIFWHGTVPSAFPDCFYPLVVSVLIFISVVQVLKNSSQSLRNVTLTLLSFLYISWFLSHLIMLRILGPYFVISVLFVTWMSDTAAYLSGSFFGKHKLAARISPQKSVEGAIGAVVCSLITIFFVRIIFLGELISLTITDCVILGFLLGGMNILGDIVESAIKRNSHVRHSGKLVPGHGGILDVIDSLLFTAPAMYYYLKIFKLS